jgi:hypothetical protein
MNGGSITGCANLNVANGYTFNVNSTNGNTIINGSTSITNLSVLQNASIQKLNVISNLALNGVLGSRNTVLGGNQNGIPTWQNQFISSLGTILPQNSWIQMNSTNTTYPNISSHIGYNISSKYNGTDTLSANVDMNIVIPNFSLNPGVYIVSYQLEYNATIPVSPTNIYSYFKLNNSITRLGAFNTRATQMISSGNPYFVTCTDIVPINTTNNIVTFTTGTNVDGLNVNKENSYFKALRIA